MTHWSSSHVAFLRQVAPEIDVPLYLLRVDESSIEWQDHWLACFSPLSDLRSQTALESLGLWAGRGVAITVRDDFSAWSQRCQCGTLLHELSHGLEHLSQPDALAIELTPIAREWLKTGEQKMLTDAGIDRNTLIRGQHGAEFVRICCHLHKRASSEMMISPGDLQFLHGAYSLGSERFEAVTEALSSELARTRNLNLTRLREPPEAFTELSRLFT